MSMEQAKAIREKREFAQELEDIQDFEKKVIGRSSRKKIGSTGGTESSDEDESDHDEGEGEPRKKRSVCSSLDAFCDVDDAISPGRMLETASTLSSRTKVMTIRYIAMIHCTPVILPIVRALAIEC
jgi:hypothetical protein